MPTRPRPEPKDENARKTMRANRAKNTGLEMKLRWAIWAAGLRGYRVHPKNVFGKPDVYLARAKLAIFVHGCYWHGCPNCTRNLTPKHNAGYWREKIARNQARDSQVQSSLAEAGIVAIVIWECEVKKDLDAIVERILTVAANPPK